MIEDILPRKTVIADGVLTEVAFDFEVVNAEYIKVYLNGVLQNSGWSLSDNKIIFTSAPSANTTITVIRDLPVNYISPIKSRGALTSDKIDEHLSEMTAKVQTLSEKISRVPTYPVDTLLTGEQITEDFLEKFQKSSDNLASISEAKDEVVTAKVDGIKALNDETARLTAQVANAIDGKVDTAENAATSAENFAETSKQWAIKMDDKVANEDYSAKYYANQAQISASLTKLDDKLTNCLLNVPQDIKLELSNGTLTLKAGSKVYVPNGVGVFDEVVIDNDKNLTNSFTGTYNDIAVVYVKSTNTIQADVMSTRFCSGATDEFSSLSGTHYWYDTTNNIIRKMTGTEQIDEVSLPICLMRNVSNQGFSEIKEIFNGFGYIGNTAFALPGVEYLSPNGRNADGSLNNIKNIVSSLITRTNPIGSNLTYFRLSTRSGLIDMGKNTYYEQEEEPTTAVYSLWYKPSENIMRYVNNIARQWIKNNSIYAITASADSTGRITSFNPKLPIRLADDQEVVHKKGDEIIEGFKTFNNVIELASSAADIDIIQKNLNDTSGVSPSIQQIRSFRVVDKNRFILGDLRVVHHTSGDVSTEVLARNKNSSGSRKSALLSVKVTPEGEVSTSAPTPPSGDNSTQIATTNWCYDPAKSTNLVHRSGNETIGGTKTFLPDSRTIYLKDDETILANNPSVNRYPCRFIWLDKNNVQLGYMQIYEHTNGNRNIGIGIRDKQNTAFHALSVWVEPNGTAYVTVPSPSSSDNSTKVPTTAWVRNYVKTGGAQLDYTKGVTITGNGTKTTSFAGVLMINASKLDNWGSEQVTLTIDGQTFYYGNGTVNLDNPHIGQIYFPMKSRQSYNITSPNWSKITAKFFPYV